MSIIHNYVEHHHGYDGWSDYVQACNKMLADMGSKVELPFIISKTSATHLAEDWGVNVKLDMGRARTIIDSTVVMEYGVVNGEKVELRASSVAAECAKRYEVAFNVLVLLRRVKKGETSYTTTWTFKTLNDYKNLAELLAANFGADEKYTVCNNQAKVAVALTHVLTGENGSVNNRIVSRAR